jgi:hypothetical protein
MHMKSILEPSLPIKVWGPMRATHNAFQGVVMTSFGGRCPYFWLCLLLTWKDWQVLTYLRMVVCIPFVEAEAINSNQIALMTLEQILLEL